LRRLEQNQSAASDFQNNVRHVTVCRTHM